MENLVFQILKRVPQIMASWNLHPELASRYAVLEAVLPLFGLSAPEIISGYRSPEKQRQLIENWNAGREIYPVGMPTVRPACESRHTMTYLGVPLAGAFDVGTKTGSLNEFARLWTMFPSSRWGGAFSTPDPNHFDFTMPLLKSQKVC